MELRKQENKEQWSLIRFLKTIQSEKFMFQVPRSKHGRTLKEQRKKKVYSTVDWAMHPKACMPHAPETHGSAKRHKIASTCAPTHGSG